MRHVEDARRLGGRMELDMSVVEVHGNEVTDLLHGRSTVGAWQGVAARAVLQGAAKADVTDLVGVLLWQAPRRARLRPTG